MCRKRCRFPPPVRGKRHPPVRLISHFTPRTGLPTLLQRGQTSSTYFFSRFLPVGVALLSPCQHAAHCTARFLFFFFRFDSLFPRCARLTCLFCVGRCSAAPNAVRSGSRENGFPRGNLVSRRIPPRLSLRAATLWGKRAPDGTESVRGVPLVGDVSRALGGGLKFSGTRSLLTDRERPRAGFIGRAHYASLCHLNSLTSLP